MRSKPKDPYREWSYRDFCEARNDPGQRDNVRKFEQDLASSERAYDEYLRVGYFSDPNPKGRFHRRNMKPKIEVLGSRTNTGINTGIIDWYIRITIQNGMKLVSNTTYTTRKSALRGARRMVRNMSAVTYNKWLDALRQIDNLAGERQK